MTFPTLSIGPLVLSVLVGRPYPFLFEVHAEAYDGALRAGITLFGLEIHLAWRTPRVPYRSRFWTVGLLVAVFVDLFHVDMWFLRFNQEVKP